jgi:hypothetical protein
MPIIIPTIDEIERMDIRQREQLIKRINGDRVRAADSIAFLTHKPRIRVSFVSNADIKAAVARSALRRQEDDAETIIADARHLLSKMPRDPDAALHRREAIEATGRKRND